MAVKCLSRPVQIPPSSADLERRQREENPVILFINGAKPFRAWQPGLACLAGYLTRRGRLSTHTRRLLGIPYGARSSIVYAGGREESVVMVV